MNSFGTSINKLQTQQLNTTADSASPQIKRPCRLIKTGNRNRYSANAVLESRPLYPELISSIEPPPKTPRPPIPMYDSRFPPQIKLHVRNVELHIQQMKQKQSEGPIRKRANTSIFATSSSLFSSSPSGTLPDASNFASAPPPIVSYSAQPQANEESDINNTNEEFGAQPRLGGHIKRTKKTQKTESTKEFLEKAKKVVNVIRDKQYNPLYHMVERPKSVNLVIPKNFIVTLENRELLFQY